MNRFSRPSEAYAYAALANNRMGAIQPAMCFLAVLIGGLAACLFVPESGWYNVGALRLSGIAMALGLTFGLFLSAVRSPIALFRAELILMVGLVYWLVFDAIQNRYGVYVRREFIIQLFAGVTVFTAFFWLGAGLASRFGFGTPQQAPPPLRELGADFVFWAAIACALMGLSYKSLSCHLQFDCLYEGLLAPRFGGGYLDYSFGPLKRLRPAGYLALPLAVVYFILQKRLSPRGLVLLLLVFANVVLLLTDGRRAVGTTLGAGALIYVLMRQRITTRHLMALAGATAFILLLLEAMLAWRNVGFGQALETERPIYNSGIIAVDKNLYHSTRAMALVPSRHDHTGWDGVAYTFGYLIPQSIWKRPPKLGFDYASATGRRGRDRWTATFSVIGDLWIIGGFIALSIGGLLYGVMANMTSRILLKPASARNRLMYVTLVMALFVSLRAMHELTSTGLAAAALWGLYNMRDHLLSEALARRTVLRRDPRNSSATF